MSQASRALSNLRGIVIVIVLAFHSSLAYLVSVPDQSARFDQAPYTWQAFPIVDTHRWIGFDVFCAWQDVSLMSLMFFLSGLFVAPGLLRKGCWTFVTDRIWRIGLPFVLVILFLSPLALYPAYSVRTVDPSFVGFWQQWTSLPFWPTGPEWFLCLLLIMNMMAAGLYAVAPGYIKQLGRLAAWACERPIRFLAILVTISLMAYVPLALAYSPWSWISVGPFSLQLSRPAIYLTYFFAGLAVGQVGLDRGLLTSDGLLARRWLMWLGAAVVSFGAWAGLTSLTMPDWARLTSPLRLPRPLPTLLPAPPDVCSCSPSACGLAAIIYWFSTASRQTPTRCTWCIMFSWCGCNTPFSAAISFRSPRSPSCSAAP